MHDPVGIADTSVLAVCAHPDDESFGLGAVLSHMASMGADVSVLCFTRGEASTLGRREQDLSGVRSAELRCAAELLGVDRVHLLDHPDGMLQKVPLGQLSEEVAAMSAEVSADLLLVFDEGGITGHPDHCRATEAALSATLGLPVLAWCLPRLLGEELEAEFGVRLVGRSEDEVDLTLVVERATQRRAIACHASQQVDNQFLWRRLQLMGERESLRWLRRPIRGDAFSRLLAGEGASEPATLGSGGSDDGAVTPAS